MTAMAEMMSLLTPLVAGVQGTSQPILLSGERRDRFLELWPLAAAEWSALLYQQGYGVAADATQTDQDAGSGGSFTPPAQQGDDDTQTDQTP